MTPQSTKPILYIVVNNHFDLTWRRCWQRTFEFKGQHYISYLDIETYYLLDNIALAEKCLGYKFAAESVQVVRKFLERCPEKLADLQRLQREGRFAITGGGEAIIDANMVNGESLVRNYIDGLLWVEDTFGQKTRLAVRNDAFGNSAQLPQILRGCEIKWATGISYSVAEGIYWRGLDGSTILHRTLPVVAAGGRRGEIPTLQHLQRKRANRRGHMPGLRWSRDRPCTALWTTRRD
jgi:alpha-mannosidase